MADADKFGNRRDQAIAGLHLRYIEVMEARLDSLSDESKDHYFRILSTLTDKLAVPTKPLHEIVGEIMSEAAPLLFQVMQR
jgi:hypothetical protein